MISGIIRLGQLRNPGDTDIDIADAVPGRIVDNTGLWQMKDLLEGFYGIGGILAVNTVRSDLRDQRIALEMVFN